MARPRLNSLSSEGQYPSSGEKLKELRAATALQQFVTPRWRKRMKPGSFLSVESCCVKLNLAESPSGNANCSCCASLGRGQQHALLHTSVRSCVKGCSRCWLVTEALQHRQTALHWAYHKRCPSQSSQTHGVSQAQELPLKDEHVCYWQELRSLLLRASGQLKEAIIRWFEFEERNQLSQLGNTKVECGWRRGWNDGKEISY